MAPPGMPKMISAPTRWSERTRLWAPVIRSGARAGLAGFGSVIASLRAVLRTGTKKPLVQGTEGRARQLVSAGAPRNYEDSGAGHSLRVTQGAAYVNSVVPLSGTSIPLATAL
jgi:hypothetical protein